MKLRKYKACELDPRSLVVPIKDVNKAIDKVRNEAIRSYKILYESGNIDLEIKHLLIKKICEL